MKRFAHPIIFGSLVEGLSAFFFVRFWGPDGDPAIRLVVMMLHLPGLLISSAALGLGNGNEVLPSILVMLALWILFFYRLRAHLRGPDRQKPVTSRGLQIIAIVTILGVATVLLIQRFGPFPRQMRNMAAAEQHIQILLPKLHQDARFTNIVLHSYTGSGGSLMVSGELFSESDLQELKTMVEVSKPPVKVVYYVPVYPPESRQDLENQVATNKNK